MKIICSQSDLNTNLSLVNRVVPSRPNLTVLSNVLIEADETTQKVSLTAFDRELGIRTNFSAEVIEGGRITLPARLFNDIVSRLPEMEITLSTAGDDNDSDMEEEILAILSAASGQFQLRGIAASQFPPLPQIESTDTIEIPAASFLAGLRSCLFAASSEPSKQILTGIHVKTPGDEDFASYDSLEFAATDSHRLAVAETSLATEDTEDPPIAKITNFFAVTIPAKALRELERMLASSQPEEIVNLVFDETQVAFELGIRGNGDANRRLTSLRLTGAYPQYEQLIPDRFSRSAIVERKRLLSSLELVAAIADRQNNIVKFSLNGKEGQLCLSVDAKDIGNAKQFIPADLTGEDTEIAFNIKYLMDGLKALPASDIKMQLNEWNQPVIFTPLGSLKMTYLVMPVQIKN